MKVFNLNTYIEVRYSYSIGYSGSHFCAKSRLYKTILLVVTNTKSPSHQGFSSAHDFCHPKPSQTTT